MHVRAVGVARTWLRVDCTYGRTTQENDISERRQSTITQRGVHSYPWSSEDIKVVKAASSILRNVCDCG